MALPILFIYATICVHFTSGIIDWFDLPTSYNSKFFARIQVEREADPSICQEASTEFCAGSFISKSHVITSASCVKGSKEIVVIDGDFSKLANESDVHRNVEVSSVKFYEKTDASEFQSKPTIDLAILKLASDVASDKVIKLCDKKFVDEDKWMKHRRILYTIGMGAINSDRKVWPYKTYLQTTNSLFSNYIYEDPKEQVHMQHLRRCEENQICFHDVQGSRMCKGDEGAPLVSIKDKCLMGVGGNVESTDTKWCVGESRFSDVFKLKDWITNSIKGN